MDLLRITGAAARWCRRGGRDEGRSVVVDNTNPRRGRPPHASPGARPTGGRHFVAARRLPGAEPTARTAVPDALHPRAAGLAKVDRGRCEPGPRASADGDGPGSGPAMLRSDRVRARPARHPDAGQARWHIGVLEHVRRRRRRLGDVPAMAAVRHAPGTGSAVAAPPGHLPPRPGRIPRDFRRMGSGKRGRDRPSIHRPFPSRSGHNGEAGHFIGLFRGQKRAQAP